MAALSTSRGLIFVFFVIFVLFGAGVRFHDSSLVVVEREVGFSFGGPERLQKIKTDSAASFLGVAGFGVPDSAALHSPSLYDEMGAFYGFLSPIIASRSTSGSYTYTVRPNDTLSQIAEDFGISADLLRRANPTAVRLLRVGQEIVIPRSRGLDASSHNSVFEVISDSVSVATPSSNSFLSASDLPNFNNDFVLPARGWNWGRLHENNAVDIANACGSPIVAAATGVVIEESSKDFWNRGYGNYLLLEHDNGAQTRYAHTLRNLVVIGEKVSQGQEIALMGNTGNTNGPTGCHLHFEVLNALNPFSK